MTDVKVVIRRLTLPVKQWDLSTDKGKNNFLIETTSTEVRDYLLSAVVEGGEKNGGFTVREADKGVTGKQLQTVVKNFLRDVKAVVKTYHFIPKADIMMYQTRIQRYMDEGDYRWSPNVNVPTTLIKIARLAGACPGGHAPRCPCGQATIAISATGKCDYGLIVNWEYLEKFGYVRREVDASS